ncbi:hypothetical protein FHS31_003088 [Sphingomonas vulcanisoli]|uniref:Glycosyltransferase 2-like domain-containing protein n=1 Tax=Sphingomonas vulcanisoli TaxID=1658060 RepID=A0ABX0TVJ3_9SPHN|nr:glycosyltransferase family 2 protein [Sphingomonas vulcanisoli]NIJ09456.1 hypothetical protein [Sphingomonas vulcanisoli]
MDEVFDQMTGAQPVLLSILIPTYDRPTCLQFLIARLLSQIDVEQIGIAIEIVVSDNQSPEPIDEMLDGWRAQGKAIRYVRPERHFASAEENFFFGLQACRGNYVWPIGDDDIPVTDAVRTVLALVERNAADFILMNSAQIDTSGEIIDAKQGKFDHSLTDVNIIDLAQLFGLTTILASFSSVVFRREFMLKIDIGQYLAQSPIYSHVAAYLEAFANARSMFVSEPQILLREGTSLEAFKRYAEVHAQATYSPWVKGLFQLRTHLLARGVIEPDLLLHTLEVDKIGRFRTFARLLVVLGQQLELWLDDLFAGKMSRERVSAQDFAIFRDALAGAPQWALETLLIFASVRKAAETIASVDAAVRLNGLLRVRENLRSAMQFDNRVRINARSLPDQLEQIAGYRVGRFGKDYLAIPDGLALPDPAVVDFTRHDLGPPDPRVIVRPTRDALRAAIAERDRQEVPAEVGDYRLFRQDGRILAVHKELWLRWSRKVNFPGLTASATPPMTLAAPTLQSLTSQVREYSRPSAAVNHDFSLRLRWLVSVQWYCKQHPDAMGLDDDPVIACVRHLQAHENLDLSPSPLVNFDLFRRNFAQTTAGEEWSHLSALRALALEGLDAAIPFSLLFDEKWYCAAYSDAAQMVLDGLMSCGFEHYLTIGRSKRTSPGPFFDEVFYLERYADAADACDRGEVRTGAEHYLWRGADLGYSPSPNFEEERYLAVNGDVADAVARGDARSGFLHWVGNGRFEGRSINEAGEISGVRAQLAYDI